MFYNKLREEKVMKYQSYSNIKTKPVFQREDVKILADIAEELKTVTSKDLQGEVIPENIKAKTRKKTILPKESIVFINTPII